MAAMIPQQSVEGILIPEPAADPQLHPSWQDLLANCFRSAAELLSFLDIDPAQVALSHQAAAEFPLRLPLPFAQQMRKGDPNDPLLRQVLPIEQETAITAGFLADPLAEQDYSPTPGLIHKYQGRALWVLTGACAIHCRYCFRRNFPYAATRLDPVRKKQVLAYLHAQSDITEVLLSGGDPLVLNDKVLSRLTAELEDIPHLKRLRLHSRLPVVLPQRIDDKLLGWLGNSRLGTSLVIHCNHPAELSQDVKSALRRLRDSGITVLNQSVLLKGVNDDPRILVELSELLFDAGVIPYYLHCLDRVQGAAHFDVEVARARQIYRELLGSLPGYLCPRLVADIPGRDSKTLIAPE